MLSDTDREALEKLGLSYELYEEPQPAGTWSGVIITGYVLPAGFDRDRTDLLVRLPPGFPDSAPDNFWVDPRIKNSRTGVEPQNANGTERHRDRDWQFFSRHLATPWRPGIDDLRTWLAAIRRRLEEDAR